MEENKKKITKNNTRNLSEVIKLFLNLKIKKIKIIGVINQVS